MAIHLAKIYFDAATAGNPGESVGAVIIVTDDERLVFEQYLGELDNHSAEWATFDFALSCALEHNVSNALVFTDSKLIEDSMNQEAVKNEKFKHYYSQIMTKAPMFELMFVKWVPRAQNKEANHYAQQALYKMVMQSKRRKSK